MRQNRSYRDFRAFGRDEPYFERVKELREEREKYWSELPGMVTYAVDQVWAKHFGRPTYTLFDVEVPLETSEYCLDAALEFNRDDPENAYYVAAARNRALQIAREFRGMALEQYRERDSGIDIQPFEVTAPLFDTWVLLNASDLRAKGVMQ